MKKRVAIYGGSFNPFHIAHQIVILYTLETEDVDEVWVIPCFKHNFGKTLAPFLDRLAMCQLGVAALGHRVVVSDIEQAIGQVSRTLVTVRTLQQRHPDIQFSILVGSDVASEIPSWYCGQEVLDTIPIITIPRSYDHTPGSAGLPVMSSTAVREAAASGRSIKKMVPKMVEAYILKLRLYLLKKE